MAYPHWIFLLIISSFVLTGQSNTSLPNPFQPEVGIAQVRVTATPVRVPLPTQAPPPTEIVIATLTPTITPTEQGPILIEVPAETSEINVRTEPDPEAERLGVIRANERYVVTGRYFSWLRINYESSPNGRGWVFGQLVTILGNEQEIPDIDPFNPTNESIPTNEESAVSGTDDENLSEDERILVIPTSDEITTNSSSALPTFTPSSINTNSINTPAIVEDSEILITVVEEDFITSTLATVTDSGIPPLVPILLLGVGGLLGVFMVVTRR